MGALVQNEQLKFDYWKKVSKENRKPVVQYDESLDTFFFYAVAAEEGLVITHYIDANVAFLYRYSDKEIIGLKVEYLKKRFLQKYANKNWMLSKTGVQLQGIKDLVVRIELSNTSPINELVAHRRIESRVRPEPVFA